MKTAGSARPYGCCGQPWRNIVAIRVGAGLSIGGYATWSVLERYGELFAAGVPIYGWGNSAMGDQLAKIPIWGLQRNSYFSKSYIIEKWISRPFHHSPSKVCVMLTLAAANYK